MNKKGEMTSSQIAMLIIAIAGFIIVLFALLVILDLRSLSEQELCRISILTRATSPESLQRLAPLKCTTQKICLSPSGGEDCTKNQFVGEKKDSIQKIKVTNEKDLEKAVADSMLDCWKMTGEGKLDVFGGGKDLGIWNWLGAKNLFEKPSVCLICSRLAVSKIPENILNKTDVTSYMETTLAPKSDQTYIQLLTDRQLRYFPRDFRNNLSEEKGKAGSTDEVAIIFMQISTPEVWDATKETGGRMATAVFVGTVGINPIGMFKVGNLLSLLTGVTTGTIAALQTWRSREIAAAYCGELTSIDKKSARNGCSVVMPVDYKDIQFINKYCSIIEGNP